VHLKEETERLLGEFGKARVPSKQKRKSEENDAHQARCKRIFDGFDHTNEYDPSLHTDTDELEITNAIATMERIRGSCSDWKPVLTDNGASFPHSIQGWCQFNQETKWAESLAILPQVDAPPSQVFAKFTEQHATRYTEDTNFTEIIDENFTTRLEYIPMPMPSPLHDREMLYRGVRKKLEGGGFMFVSYGVEDERKPLGSGRTRMGVKGALWVRPLEGSDGKASEVWRCASVQPNFGSIVGSMLNSLVTMKSAANVAAPLVQLKEETERLLGEYEPQLEENASGTQSLTWKGQLLNIATQCALGVQYLHQEQYWAEEEKNEDGTIIPAGYRQCIIHRDLKPDNMLLTKDWQLKLTDFGEARAVNLNQVRSAKNDGRNATAARPPRAAPPLFTHVFGSLLTRVCDRR